MQKGKNTIVTIAIMSALAASGIVAAQDKYELNIQAYKGITFGQLFGNVADSVAQVTLTPSADISPAASDENAAISLGAFIVSLSANLQQYNPTSAEDAALVANVKDRLASLNTYLDQTNTAENGCVKTWPLRWFFEADLKSRAFDNADIQTAVQTLFRDHFEPLDDAGLTLPWLLVAEREANADFLDLVFNTGFLQRLSRMTYEDFFKTGIDSPLVDDEFMEVTRQAIQAGLFGAWHAYKDSPNATVGLSELASGVSPLVASYCCDRTRRVCRPITYSGANCNMCGNYCCLGSTFCP